MPDRHTIVLEKIYLMLVVLADKILSREELDVLRLELERIQRAGRS